MKVWSEFSRENYRFSRKLYVKIIKSRVKIPKKYAVETPNESLGRLFP
jgi:hypothetical protein